MKYPKNTLKVHYLLPDFDENAYSGGLYVIFEHCNGLIRRGHSVRTFNNTGKRSRYLKLECDVERHMDDPRIVEGDSPHIIIGTHWRTYFFLNRMKDAVKNNTKLCMLVQSDDRYLVSDEEKPLVSKALTNKYRGNLPIHKIVISQYLADMLKEDFGQDSFYIRNGFEARDVRALLEKTGKVRILARYDTSRYRGWDVIDRLFKRLAKERKDIEIHLFEMKTKRPTVYKSIFHKGLIGQRLLALFKSCDIYLSASTYEGFSYPIIEAMSQACAVCCTDAGGNGEFCVDGKTALVSARDDEDGLYKNLARLIDDKGLRDMLGSNGIDKIKEFHWDDSIDKLEEYFSLIAAERYDLNGLPESSEAKPNRCADKGNFLLVYWKDPLTDYKRWVDMDELTSYLIDSGYKTETVLFVDSHPYKAARARLEMLFPREKTGLFRSVVLYNKHIKFRNRVVNDMLFSAYLLWYILRASLIKENRLTAIVLAGRESGILRFLCMLFNARFYGLNLCDEKIDAYSFNIYDKEFNRKETEYRALIRQKIKSSIGA